MTLANIRDFLVEGSMLYVAAGNAIYSVPTSGGMPQMVTTGYEPRDLAMWGPEIYFSDYLGGGIFKVHKSGGAAMPVVAANQPDQIAIGGGFVYFQHEPSLLSRAPLGGGAGVAIHTFSYPNYFGQLMRDDVLDEVWFWQGVSETGTDTWHLYRVDPSGSPQFGLTWIQNLSVFDGVGSLLAVHRPYLLGADDIREWSMPSLQPLPTVSMGTWMQVRDCTADAASLLMANDINDGALASVHVVQVANRCNATHEAVAVMPNWGGLTQLAVDSHDVYVWRNDDNIYKVPR